MIDITKVAYTSQLYYPEIIYNQMHTMNNGQTLTIPFDTSYIPYIRVWGELFVGEFSAVWISSAQYGFSNDYENQSIYGYIIEIRDNNLTIYCNNPTPRRVYIRMYASE